MLKQNLKKSMPALTAKLVNVALYQAGWLCCILGAAWGRPIVGGLAALVLVGAHLWLARARCAEVRLMAAACLIGITVDSLQQGMGAFTFKTDPAWPLPIPLWMAVLWIQFATLFHYALHWLSGRYLLSALLGMIGGTLAYGGGIRLRAAVLGENPILSFVTIAIVWSMVTPTLLWLSDRISKKEGEYRRLAFRNESAEPPADEEAKDSNQGAKHNPPSYIDHYDS